MGKKILIIDDDPIATRLIEYTLKKRGYHILTSLNGLEGLQIAQNEELDLIVLNVMLPGIDGLEATKRIRESEADTETPIVALTSYIMTGDREKALNAGCTGYLEKPINPETFMASVENYL